MSSLAELFLAGTAMTLALALVSLVVGLILAVVVAIAELSPFKIISWPTQFVVLILRGLPEVLVVMFIYFGASQLIFLLSGSYIEISPFVAGVSALSLMYCAYASQTIRGALLAVPKGQAEAAMALGISKSRYFCSITLPQAWRHALPGLGNQWLVLLKDTALVALIGVTELLRQSQLMAAKTYQPFTWYATAAVIYLLITLASQYLLKKMTQRANRHIGHAKQENVG